MILEIAQFDISNGKELDFEKGVQTALPLFQAAKGFRSLSLTRSIEFPSRYRVLIEWETLEDHTIAFRSSDAFPKWRELVSHTFAAPPSVEHVETITF